MSSRHKPPGLLVNVPLKILAVVEKRSKDWIWKGQNILGHVMPYSRFHLTLGIAIVGKTRGKTID
jgi:hypothetical protein